MNLSKTTELKPDGTFTELCAVKTCEKCGHVILLGRKTARHFRVVNPRDFANPHANGDLRKVKYTRETTPEGEQIVHLLAVQSYDHDESIFSAISVN